MTARFKVFFHLLGRRGRDSEGEGHKREGGKEGELETEKLCENRIVPMSRIMSKREGKESCVWDLEEDGKH